MDIPYSIASIIATTRYYFNSIVTLYASLLFSPTSPAPCEMPSSPRLRQYPSAFFSALHPTFSNIVSNLIETFQRAKA